MDTSSLQNHMALIRRNTITGMSSFLENKVTSVTTASIDRGLHLKWATHKK